MSSAPTGTHGQTAVFPHAPHSMLHVSCQGCQRCFTSTRSLSNHGRFCKAPPSKPIPHEPPPVCSLICTSCGKTCASKSGLTNHKLRFCKGVCQTIPQSPVTQKQPLTFTVRGKACGSKRGLSSHQLRFCRGPGSPHSPTPGRPSSALSQYSPVQQLPTTSSSPTALSVFSPLSFDTGSADMSPTADAPATAKTDVSDSSLALASNAKQPESPDTEIPTPTADQPRPQKGRFEVLKPLYLLSSRKRPGNNYKAKLLQWLLKFWPNLMTRTSSPTGTASKKLLLD